MTIHLQKPLDNILNDSVVNTLNISNTYILGNNTIHQPVDRALIDDIMEDNKKVSIIIYDDTMVPVINIKNKYFNAVMQWNDMCLIEMEYEKTHIIVPPNIKREELQKYTFFKEIDILHKDDYLNNYLPLLLKKITDDKFLIECEYKYTRKINKINKINLNNCIDLYNQKRIEVENVLTGRKQSEEQGLPEVYKAIETDVVDTQTIEPPSSLILKQLKIFIPKQLQKQDKKSKDFINYTLTQTTKTYFPEPYNADYNVLKPKFGENHYNYYNKSDKNYILTEQPTDNSAFSIMVVLNHKFLCTLVIDNPDEMIEIFADYYTEFGFCTLFKYDCDNEEILNYIKKEFHTQTFSSNEQINKKILLLSNYITLERDSAENNLTIDINEEEQKVKDFLDTQFIISDRLENKMKATQLYDFIIGSAFETTDKDKINGLKLRLSKYLKNYGLLKKRYNDGFYYYGIISKKLENNLGKILEFDINELMRKREEELMGFYNEKKK